MPDWISRTPGHLYVVATLLPLLSFAMLLLVGTIRNFCRPLKQFEGAASGIYWMCGGDRPLRAGAIMATISMAIAATLAITGLVTYLADTDKALPSAEMAARWSGRTDWVRLGSADTLPPSEWASQHARDPSLPAPSLGLALELGYRIDQLSALLFAMVTLIATAIFIFSLSYMNDEMQETVEDHHIHAPPGAHAYRRRGRYGRFFLYLSLFCFAMLNLIIADNLFQVFVSWELVGCCSFFLIGFYYERPSASRAATKAFIVNRVGDAGFLIGILIAWSYFGTLNIDEMTSRARSPFDHGGQLIRLNPTANNESGGQRYRLPDDSKTAGSHLLLFPIIGEEPAREISITHTQSYRSFGVIPYWLFIVMGLGLFLGCVGKSAQIPLHTWLPDAMEGPTPVSALIHAATMVAAGVYLVGRCFPLFAPEVLLVIAYVGAITLFISATIAMVQTDIKRVLAYSTCSQLGFMMLALGVGGWVAGLLHLLTHAFFKALLFLGAGSVIHGCHHEQDLRKMGGLAGRMKITALTMLIGVLAIAGAPFFSGWYSKDLLLATALGYAIAHPAHLMLAVLPIATAGLTAFYMFRLWFLVFSGQPRDEGVHEHVHESPWLMTIPLILLALCSIGIAWGWPIWEADASYLGQLLRRGESSAVAVEFAAERSETHDHHLIAGVLALAVALAGAGLAAAMYWRHLLDPARARARLHLLDKLFAQKWYFDELYRILFVSPTLALARRAAATDRRPTEATPPPGVSELPPRQFDMQTLDGWINSFGQLLAVAGRALRFVQVGNIRTYILFLALTVTAMLGILVFYQTHS